jgi:uncharacterized protein YceH (UPF0502 family)
MTDLPPQPSQAQPPRWRPLSAIDRRVIGVLVEKAKTTPDAYPMSLNAICAGCNQKNNRHPLMQLEPDAVEASLDRLREMGAAAIVQGGGRVSRYRHYMYEWLGVDKVEMAVMTELLLRGAQTEGELRGRAARMEPIADVAALRPILQSLKSKGLVISLTGEGRGHVLTHNLYEPRELERLQAQFAAGQPSTTETTASQTLPRPAEAANSGAPNVPSAVAVPRMPPQTPPAAELQPLRDQVAQLRSDLDELATEVRRCREELQQLKDQLGA